jgi:hypothetical protein
MMSRREVVTAGVLGTLSSGAGPVTAEAETEQGDVAVRQALLDIKKELEEMKGHIHTGLVASSLSTGRVGQVNERIEKFLRSAGKFPEFCDIGTSVFYEVYDWHVKHQQQIDVTRLADQRLMIRFMFTQLVLRWENDGNYIGAPFDR